MSNNNADNIKDAGINSQADLDEMIPKYFSVIKTCEEDNLTECMIAPDKYKKLNGEKVFYSASSNPIYGMQPVYGTKAYIFSDGSTARFRYLKGDILLIVDTNGKKKPNIQGKDLFTMKRYFNNKFGDWHPFEYGCCSGVSGEPGVRFGGCFGKILELNWHLNDSNYCPQWKY